MTAQNEGSAAQHHDGSAVFGIDMFETGGEEDSGFHVFNLAPDHYHRAEGLQRTGAIDITCNIEQILHGAMSADSDYYATLIVMRWLFQPKGSRRISEATIDLLFEPEPGGGDTEVEKISYPSTYSLIPTTEEESTTKGGETTVGIEQIGSLSAAGKWEKTVTKTTSHAITLSGGKRLVNNRPPYRIATWTLSENESQRSGIPASLKVAVLVSREDRKKFFCRLSLRCKTDWATAAEALFTKIPKDDPIIFQPDPGDKGTRPNKNVEFGNDELGGVDLDALCDVTYRTVINDGQKIWK